MWFILVTEIRKRHHLNPRIYIEECTNYHKYTKLNNTKYNPVAQVLLECPKQGKNGGNFFLTQWCSLCAQTKNIMPFHFITVSLCLLNSTIITIYTKMAHIIISKRCTELFSTNSQTNSKNILILFEEGPKTLVLTGMEKLCSIYDSNLCSISSAYHINMGVTIRCQIAILNSCFLTQMWRQHVPW